MKVQGSKRWRSGFVPKERPRVVVSLPYESPLMHTIVELSREWNWDLLDYSLVYGVFPDDPAPSGAIVDALWDSPLVQQLSRNDCAVLRMGRLGNQHDHLLPAVLPDMEAAGRLAATHFIERSFKHLVYFGWNTSESHADSHLYYQSFRDCAEASGVSVQLYEMSKHHKPDEDPAVRFARRQREMGGWLKLMPKPLGIATYADWMAAQLCVICRNVGICVPEEVAILGIGNTTWCERSPVELSSVILSDEDRARKGMFLLRDLMEGRLRNVSGSIMVPPSGIEQRRSTDILAIDDLKVAIAIRFIWEHSNEPIGVGDVAAAVALSERQLERRFQQGLGATINQKLVTRRLDQVKHLLQTTTLSVSDIGPMTGFRSARHLHHAFRQAVGMTPIQFRKKFNIRRSEVSWKWRVESGEWGERTTKHTKCG